MLLYIKITQLSSITSLGNIRSRSRSQASKRFHKLSGPELVGTCLHLIKTYIHSILLSIYIINIKGCEYCRIVTLRFSGFSES